MRYESYLEEYLLEALTQVSAWDVPDEYFIQAVNEQAKLLAGITDGKNVQQNVTLQKIKQTLKKEECI